jgi:hypothetical protein
MVAVGLSWVVDSDARIDRQETLAYITLLLFTTSYLCLHSYIGTLVNGNTFQGSSIAFTGHLAILRL